MTRKLLLVMAGIVLVAACSSSATTAPPTATAAPTAVAPTAVAPTAASTSTAAPSATTAPTAWQPDPSCHSTDPVVQKAIADTIARSGPQSTWFGPTTTLKPPATGKIVYLVGSAQNQGTVEAAQSVEAVANKIGWSASWIDGKGTAEGWDTAMTEAIATNPTAIVIDADAASISSMSKQAVAKGITVIGVHAVALDGPSPQYSLYDNISSDPVAIATAEAEYAIADSCGTAKVIIEYDSAYQIATLKGDSMLAAMQKCTTCQVLAFVDSPLAELQTQQPVLCSNWALKYGSGWYGMTITDSVWDYCVPALKTAGIGPTAVHLIGSDGTLSGYQRMSTGLYQVATVPEPVPMFGYIVVDEAVRAALGLPTDYGRDPSQGQWEQPVFVAFSDAGHGSNLSTEGGDKQEFFPSNDFANKFLALWGVTP